MTDSFEIQKNTKAFSYTVIICLLLLAIMFLYKWRIAIPPIPAIQDLIEINLGNEQEGLGDVQPLVKGDPAPDVPLPQSVKSAATHDAPSKEIQADENDDKEAASVPKIVKPNKEAKEVARETVTKPIKTNNPVPVVNPKPTPPKLKVPLYKGGNGPGGNGADQDNGYKNQGYKPGNGDNGSPNGKPDSYGNTPGGKVTGPRVTSGDRKIVRFYSFSDDLDKAIIYAIIRVSPDGRGTFAGFARNSSTTNSAYASAISRHLPNIQFDKSDHESTVTVQFNFTVQ